MPIIVEITVEVNQTGVVLVFTATYNYPLELLEFISHNEMSVIFDKLKQV